jgi:hypothetical protein
MRLQILVPSPGGRARRWPPPHRWWRGRCRAARRTAPTAPRSAGPVPGRARSPPRQDLEYKSRANRERCVVQWWRRSQAARAALGSRPTPRQPKPLPIYLWRTGSPASRIPAGRYPKMAAGRERRRVLAMTTPGRASAILDGEERPAPNHRTCQMPQVRTTNQRRTADTRWRRRRDPPLPPDPRDPDLTRAKQLQRKRGCP